MLTHDDGECVGVSSSSVLLQELYDVAHRHGVAWSIDHHRRTEFGSYESAETGELLLSAQDIVPPVPSRRSQLTPSPQELQSSLAT